MAGKGLPEVNVTGGVLVDESVRYVKTRAEKAALESQEKAIKAKLESESEALRAEKLKAKEVVGLIRITNEQGQAPVRVEFRTTDKAALDLSEEDQLNQIFQAVKPVLFQREKVVTAINNYEDLIADLKAKSIDPNTVLDFKVKTGMHGVLSGCKGVDTAEAITPRDEFLANLKENAHLISDDGWKYLTEYLAVALKPTAVAGTKGNGAAK